MTTRNPTSKNKSAMPLKENPTRASRESQGAMSWTRKISMWIEWSDADGAFIGYCPQFFPYGAVFHGHTEAKALMKLASLVRKELELGRTVGMTVSPSFQTQLSPRNWAYSSAVRAGDS